MTVMPHDNQPSTMRLFELASGFRGLYNRVAGQLKIDASYVSRVAGGQRKSATVEAALIKEITKLLRKAGFTSPA